MTAATGLKYQENREEPKLLRVCAYCDTPFDGKEYRCLHCGGPRLKAVYRREIQAQGEPKPAPSVDKWTRRLVNLEVFLVVLLYVLTGLYVLTHWGESGFTGSISFLRSTGATLAVATFFAVVFWHFRDSK